VSDPSQALSNARWETFAAARAKGLSLGQSWAKTIPFGQSYTGGDNSLRVSGHRCEAKPIVKARINWLREQMFNDAVMPAESLSRPEIIAASLEVSSALEKAYRAALGSSASPQAIERLKTVWAAHLYRQGKMDDATEPLPSTDTEEIGAMMDRICDLRECTCPTL